MNGNKVLLDSNVIIFASKGKVNIDDLFQTHDHFYVSIINYMEVLGYEFDKSEDEEIILEILKNTEIINTNIEIAETVVSYRKKSKIKLPDAIILATAKFVNAELLTDNTEDFKNIDNSVKVAPIKNLMNKKNH